MRAPPSRPKRRTDLRTVGVGRERLSYRRNADKCSIAVMSDIRILLVADTHLGFDLPVRPRVERRRRGHDFLANYAAALQPALDGEVDVVVHGGDVFDRPTVMPTLAYQALEPLRRVAEGGVPVFIVPGNHERSFLPHSRFAAHPNVHIFDGPRTFVVEARGATLALSGFPCERRDVRTKFPQLVADTEWRSHIATARVLCMHQAAEGATVGPANFRFTTAHDVIRHADVPAEFAAVLSGHIHRSQALTTDLRRRAVRTRILYPGSIERTSFAEADEPKGFMVVTVGGSGVNWTFRGLPARPMVRRVLSADALGAVALDAAIREIVSQVSADAVVSIRITGVVGEDQAAMLSAKRMREIAPASMNVDIVVEQWRRFSAPSSPRARSAADPPTPGPPPRSPLSQPPRPRADSSVDDDSARNTSCSASSPLLP